MKWPDFFWPHEVTVRDVTGSGGMGKQHGPPRRLDAEVKDEQRVVKTRDGVEIVSHANVTVRIDAGVRLGALVTVWPGEPDAEREAEVLHVGRHVERPPLESFVVLYLE
ncbi:hypothetical protein [Microbacterium halophytorum]|uniref:hypothetical protein n=1 Tax=Microbacterium halophytorum TaxID=2067568 RepID=UPI001319E10E|nr:hypothetical protein [Microbacterium halophytorum]